MNIPLDNLRLMHSVTEGLATELNRTISHQGWKFQKMSAFTMVLRRDTKYESDDKRTATLVVHLDGDANLSVDVKSDDKQFATWASGIVDNVRLS